MAIQFPKNPASQTPVNTLSPNSTPIANTENTLTYVWNGEAWIGSGDPTEETPNLQAVTNQGNTTTNNVSVGSLSSAGNAQIGGPNDTSSTTAAGVLINNAGNVFAQRAASAGATNKLYSGYYGDVRTFTVDADGSVAASGKITGAGTIQAGEGFNLSSNTGSGSRLTSSAGITSQRASTVGPTGVIFEGYKGKTSVFKVGGDGNINSEAGIAAAGVVTSESGLLTGTPQSTSVAGGASVSGTGRISVYAQPIDFSSDNWGSSSSAYQVVSKDVNDSGDMKIQAQWRADGGIRIGELNDSVSANVFIRADGQIIVQKGLETYSSVGHRFSRLNNNQTWDLITSNNSGGFFGIYNRTSTTYAIRYFDNGTSGFSGVSTFDDLRIATGLGDPDNYVSTTNAEGETDSVYCGPTLDVKALLLEFQSKIETLEAAKASLEARLSTLEGGN